MIEPIVQLQSRNFPDIVVFYDGVNDVYAGYESGLPGADLSLQRITGKFEERENLLVKWYKSSRQYSLVKKGKERLAKRFGRMTSGSPALKSQTEEMAGRVLEIYLQNYRIVSALSEEYGFDFYFYWQPHLGIDKKPLTDEEKELKSKMDPKLVDLADAAYARMDAVAPLHEYLWCISDVFEKQDEQIFIDAWGHVIPEGNRIVASKMMDTIRKR